MSTAYIMINLEKMVIRKTHCSQTYLNAMVLNRVLSTELVSHFARSFVTPSYSTRRPICTYSRAMTSC